MTNQNPLLSDWDTPFEIPPFAQIKPEHYSEAFQTALEQSEAEIDAIASNREAPSFANTIEAMELAGDALSKVSAIFYNLSGSHTNPELQAIEREMAPKLAEHSSKIMLNAGLFKRVDTLFEQGDALNLTPEQKRVLERYHASFVRSGAKLEGGERTRMSEITQRLATLGTSFAQNMLADEASYELVLESEDDLTGLPDFLVAAAASAAKERGHEGKHVITLSRSLIEPFLQFSDRRDLRERAFRAWIARGENGGETDNRDTILETLKLREERANLLGFKNFAEFKLDDQMAKTPDAVRHLLMNVWKPAKAQAANEAAKLQELANSEGANFDIEPWDWRYYAEKVRKQEHDLDEAEIKPYIQLDKIIEAAFETANRLFGLSFKEVSGLELYHPDVRAFEVSDSDARHVALFLGDYFARSSKRSGAWMSGFRSQQKLKGDIRPIIVNVMNFAKAPEGEATLLTFDDARTLFHEFGHALHGMLSDVTYPNVSGTSVARDFVELPSQLYEHWLSEPEILSKYAVHYKTGESIPQTLMDKLKAAENFNQGYATVEYTSSALVDLEYHTMPASDVTDVAEAEASILAKIGMPKEITMRHRSTHFAHVFSGDGYSSGYYSYMWSEVMDADAFRAFEETGNVFDTGIAAKLKEFIYSAGGSRDPEELYVEFRGKMPEIDALLEGRGLKDVA
ncbi:MAG: M3 family metallopeptidase [Rhizobiaceae bacterium]|nr:M3 family metallopeptidase [Rhizobiaceae bacterium]